MLITHGKVIQWGQTNRILDDHAIYIEDGIIKEIGPTEKLILHHHDPSPIDARGQFILPGNICAHTHFYGAFSRGLSIPGKQPKALSEILKKLWWPLDKSLTTEDIRYSALVCLLDAIRNGTTLLIDHHASPNAIDGSLDVIAEAVEESGLRAVLCYEVSDRDGSSVAEAGIRENERFITKVYGENMKAARIGASFGLHASLTLSDATLDTCRSRNPKNSFHIHAAEGQEDQLNCLEKTGMRVVNRLATHGILGPDSILAHCVHVDEGEIEILAHSKSWVTHQPRSNMNNGVGVAPISVMREAGVRLGMGNDGFSNAMWEEWKAAYFIHKAWHHDPQQVNGNEIIQMGVRNNAKLAETFFPGMQLGSIAEGALADLFFVNYQPFTPLTGNNLPWHILFGFQTGMVTTTIVGGKVLMEDNQIIALDEERITARAEELAKKVWKRYEELLK